MMGGQLWGEHVYAVQDGVVDRVRRGGDDEHGGGYVRIAHFGGMVFTQYFHLAAIPRGVGRGARVAAGDVVGLVGDTGVGDERNSGARAHLHFTFSIRPSSAFAETYWDPAPLMERWPLRVPPHGTVAGLAVPVNDEDLLRRRRGR
jgi:murein DD-endopeptidase MepM/ murein hydrolase activator NlpD